jgi:hypothetical protein
MCAAVMRRYKFGGLAGRRVIELFCFIDWIRTLTWLTIHFETD